MSEMETIFAFKSQCCQNTLTENVKESATKSFKTENDGELK